MKTKFFKEDPRKIKPKRMKLEDTTMKKVKDDKPCQDMGLLLLDK